MGLSREDRSAIGVGGTKHTDLVSLTVSFRFISLRGRLKALPRDEWRLQRQSQPGGERGYVEGLGKQESLCGVVEVGRTL